MTFPSDKDTVGKRLRYLRENQGLSLRGFAKQLNISGPFLFDIEHDRRGTKKLQEMCSLLGVDVSELTTFSKSEESPALDSPAGEK